MVKELIYCLVLLLLTAVLYSIYHGFLTAEKGTVEFSHTKDCSGNRLLLLNVPWRDQVALGRDPGVFMRHEKPMQELWLELIWCCPYEWSAEDWLAWNSCKYPHVCMGQQLWPSHIKESQSHDQRLWSFK